MSNKQQEKCIYPVPSHFIKDGIYGLYASGAVAGFKEFTGRERFQSNGGSSLMRLLSLGYELYFNYGEAIAQNDAAMDTMHCVLSLTDRKPAAMPACGIYVCAAVKLMAGKPLEAALSEGVKQALSWYGGRPEFAKALRSFERLRALEAFAKLPEGELRSSGLWQKIRKVRCGVPALERAFWCLMNSSNYKKCILKAANLDPHTGAAAAAAGGLAGLAYGCEERIGGIPGEWLNGLWGRRRIDEVIQTLEMRCGENEHRFSLGTFNVLEAVGCFQKAYEKNGACAQDDACGKGRCFKKNEDCEKFFYEFLVPCHNRCTIITEKWPQKEKPYCLEVSVDVKGTPNMLSCRIESFKTLDALLCYISSREGQKMIAAYIHMLIKRIWEKD